MNMNAITAHRVEAIKHNFELLKFCIDSGSHLNILFISAVLFRLIDNENMLNLREINDYDLTFRFDLLGQPLEVGSTNSSRKLEFRQETTSFSRFAGQKLLIIEGVEVTLREFLYSFLYNGGVHIVPDEENKKLSEILQKINRSFAMDELRELAAVVGKAIYNIIPNNRLSGKRRHMYAASEQLTVMYPEDIGPNLTIKMLHSAYETPINMPQDYGIRVAFDFNLEMMGGKRPYYLLSVGSKRLISSQLSVLLQGGALKIFLARKFLLKKSVKIEKNDTYLVEFWQNTKGEYRLFLNDILLDSGSSPYKFSMNKGKAVIGANLSIESFGKFKTSFLVVDSVSRLGILHNQITIGLRKIRLTSKRVGDKKPSENWRACSNFLS